MASELQELEALLEYLVKHNADHAEEITSLAGRAESMGKKEAHEQLVAGVELLNRSNEKLKAALAELRG
jgi:hypothetical protein